MQEKRNKRLLITLLLLLTATAGLYYAFSRQSTGLTIDKDIFQVADLKAVNEVVLTSPAGKTQLKYLGASWRVNGKYDADRGRVEALFATLLQAEPKRPVSTAQKDSIAQYLEKNGVKVSLLSGGTLVKEFWAGGNDRKTQAYFKEISGDTPYLVMIPGYRVYTSGIFELPESGWRDRYVFGFNWRNFKSLEATFPGRDNENLVVVWNDNLTAIKDMPEADTAKLNTYLDNVSLLAVEDYLDATPFTDSISPTKPLMTLQVKEISDKAHTLTIYALPDRRLAGLMDGTQWAILPENQTGAVIRPRTFFK